MPLLRRPDDHHRDVRRRLPSAPAPALDQSDQDRHLMTIMTPLHANKVCSPSPPATSWRWNAAPKTPARTRSGLTALGKIHTQLSRSASSPKAEASDPGAGAQNRRSPALDAVFKSP
jgi:hypothetical protein